MIEQRDAIAVHTYIPPTKVHFESFVTGMAHPTPEYDGSLTVTSTIVPTSSRKRKREDEKSVLGDPFVIKPYSSSVFDPSVKLTPAVVIPRSYIPLQWLAGYPSRLFSIPTPIQALDIPGNVIIVKVDGERQLAAVEKVKDDVCTLYKLSTQLKMKDIRKTASLVKKSRQNSESISENTDSLTGILSADWWSGLEVPNFDINNAICAAEPTIKLIVGCSDLDICHNSTLLPIQPNAPISPPATADNSLKLVEDFSEPTLTDILERTRMQYYKTLYIAKTSLAYFAKSTLSRARVAVQQEQESELPISLDSSNRFRTFLLDMYLPFDKMDTKYRKSMIQIATEDPIDDVSVFRVGEEEYVQQWRIATWDERLVQVNDSTMKRKVEELKIRETELQIIILLEMLALEREQAILVKGSPIKNKSSEKKSKKEAKRKGKRKSKTNEPDPKLLLDLLVDRLCIWRSIGSGSEVLDEESSDQKKVTDKEYDHLRHFCVEVVLAFYASRLPEECASINNKCGGSSSRTRTPGQPKKERKSQAKRPPVARVATAPAATSNVREASADTLAALVAADAASLPRKTVRGGTLNYKSFAKREVQITSRSGQQKKVDEELKEAINALKKPNRIAAASGLADESMKRISNNKSKSHSNDISQWKIAKKNPESKKPARNPLAKIQVMATPKRRRTIMPPQPASQTVTEDSPELHAHDPFYAPRIPDPRTLRDIPGTPLRRDNRRMDFDVVPATSPFQPPSEARKTATFPGGFTTPQKRQPRSSGVDLGSNFIPSSAIKNTVNPPQNDTYPSGVPKFMGKNPFDPTDEPSSPAGGVMLYDTDAVGETPCKSSAPMTRMVEEKKEISIYDSLGWDDDFDL